MGLWPGSRILIFLSLLKQRSGGESGQVLGSVGNGLLWVCQERSELQPLLHLQVGGMEDPHICTVSFQNSKLGEESPRGAGGSRRGCGCPVWVLPLLAVLTRSCWEAWTGLGPSASLAAGREQMARCGKGITCRPWLWAGARPLPSGPPCFSHPT